MSRQDLIERTDQEAETPSPVVRRHPVTLENSPEETIRRMRALPERAAKLRETICAAREAHLPT